MSTLPPLLPVPEGATWPDPAGHAHPNDGPALRAVEQAEIWLKHGDRLGCLRAVADYEFLCHCGVERPDLESRVRGIITRMGRLPRGHAVPAQVNSFDEFLAVLSVNQDSPQKTFRADSAFHYCDRDATGKREPGYVYIDVKLSALVNHGRERADGREPRRAGDIEGAYVRWDGGEFARSKADPRGQPKTPEHRRLLAENVLRLWDAVREYDTRARLYGWSMTGYDDWEAMVARVCGQGGIDPNVSVSPVPARAAKKPAKRAKKT